MKRTMMTIGGLSALVVLATITAMGCDALTVKTMGVAILTKTPDITQAGIVDQRLIDAVGDLPIDSVTLATAFVGERPSLQDQSPPAGISGATVRLQYRSQDQTGTPVLRTIDLNEITEASEAQGTYMAISVDLDDTVTDDDLYVNTDLEYIDEHDYTMLIDIQGDYYDLPLVAPAAIPAANVTFNGAALASENITIPTQADLVINTFALNTAMTVAWESADPDKPQNAFVTLARVEYTGASDWSDIFESTAWQAATTNPLYDNFPRSAEEFLTLVTEAPATEDVLDASLFDTPGLYVLMLSAVDLNTDNSMAVGSAGLAGVATPFVFMVK